MNEQIIQFLEDRAVLRKTITYGELTTRFGLPPISGAFGSHPLSKIFDVIDQEDGAAKQSFCTALVINQQTGMPGNGFFHALEMYREIHPLVKIEK